MREIKLQDLKSKTPTELITFAEELQVENASTMRKQELVAQHGNGDPGAHAPDSHAPHRNGISPRTLSSGRDH
jgi:hypothetical protein